MKRIDFTNQIHQIKKIKNKKGYKIGFTCSCFDLFHAGHIKMLQDARNQCDYLIVGLQTDPTLDRPKKNNPIQSLEERKIQLEAVKYIDEVIIYNTENDLYSLVYHIMPDIRILGTDYIDKYFTGIDIEGVDIHFHERNHDYSTSSLREKIKNI